MRLADFVTQKLGNQLIISGEINFRGLFYSVFFRLNFSQCKDN